MDELQGRRSRRLRTQRPTVLPDGLESAESVLPEVPRVGALDALLREVDSLRLTLETDLTLAAAAVENGQVAVAVEILDSEREGLRAFEAHALDHLSGLAAPKRRLRVPAAPFVAAAAVAGFLLGVVPHTAGSSPSQVTPMSSESATESLQILRDAANSGDAAQALRAATTLHAQVLAVVALAQDDPRATSQVLLLLSQEQQVLAGASHDSAALAQALAVSRQLTTQIVSLLTPRPVVTPTTVVFLGPTPRPHSTPTRSGSSPRPTSSPAAKPTHSTTTKPKPSSSPSSSSTPDDGPLPGAPGLS